MDKITLHYMHEADWNLTKALSLARDCIKIRLIDDAVGFMKAYNKIIDGPQIWDENGIIKQEFRTEG
jgi:hypothetical protein